METLDLTEAQQLAAFSREPITYVVAGPGSGKTHTLVARIISAIHEGVQPREIMALSFTNSAAHEFTERLAAAGVFGLGFCGTLHGFCFRLLQQHGDKMGYRAGRITIITEEQRLALFAAAIARVKPKMTQKEFKAGETAEARQARGEYLHTLKMNNAVDYDNILTAAKVLLLMNNIAWSLKLMAVDEVQDSGTVDWDIYDLIKAEAKFLIGDPDQSLFAFRGAKPNLFVERAHAFEAKTVLLEENYRSAPEICAAANSLIERNTGRVQKILLSSDNRRFLSGEVWQMRSKDERQEVDQLRAALEAENLRTPFDEMAVLARNNDVANRLRDGLRTAGLPVREPAPDTLPLDWPRCVAALAFLHDPDNEIAAMTWLSLDQDAGLVAKWQRDCAINKRTLAAEANVEPADWETDLGAVRSALLARSVSVESVMLVEDRAALLPPGATLADLMEDLWNVRTWARPMRGEGITVTTIHQAKGREWDCVVVAGCEETRLPGRGNIEEERRIMFVAMTRARRWLCLSSCKMRTGHGGAPEFLFVSRFVEEAGVQ